MSWDRNSANDRAETRAIKEALGKHSKEISIGGIKSMTGHAFGGATAIEVAQLVKSLETKVVPPTINYSEFDPECDLDCVPNEAKKTFKMRLCAENCSRFWRF